MKHEFLIVWDGYMEIVALGCVFIGLVIFLYYRFKVSQFKDPKEKYDYVNFYEVRNIWYSIVALLIACVFYFNSVKTETIVRYGDLWFYARIFLTLIFTTVCYSFLYNIIKFYYPIFVEKRLVKLRNTPRISPAGNIMHKLSEEEEDAHLDKKQIEEEETIHSVDYDVWLDDKTGFKKIEKYESYLHAEQCSECGFYTSVIYKEEIDVPASGSNKGSLLKHYRCNYCNHREVKEVKIAEN